MFWFDVGTILLSWDGEIIMKYRSKIENYLLDVISDSADDALDFLDLRHDVQEQISEELSNLSDDELDTVFNTYVFEYDSVEHFISKIEDEENERN